MYNNGTPLSALSDAWEAVTTAKKQLTNVDTKIRQSGLPTSQQLGGTRNVAFANPKQRSKNNPNIERRVVVDHNGGNFYRNENLPPPASHSHAKGYTDYYKSSADPPRGYTKDYAPDFNYMPVQTDPIDKSILNSSLAGKVLLAKKNNSNALNRLKERIEQQKLNASLSNNTTCSSTARQPEFPAKPRHTEDDIVSAPPSSVPHTLSGEPMIRKVAHAPTAPQYKGFNQADNCTAKSRFITSEPKEKMSKPSKKEDYHRKVAKPKKHYQDNVGDGVKTKDRMHRIVSPKKPTAPITTSSWRVGQEIRKNLIKEQKQQMNAKSAGSKPKITKEESTAPSGSTVDNTEKSTGDADSQSNEESSSTQGVTAVKRDDLETMNDEVSIPSDNADNVTAKTEQASGSAPIDAISAVNDVSDNDDNTNAKSSEVPAKESKPLTGIAQSIMKDLNAAPVEKSPKGKKVVSAVVDTGLKKKPTKVPVKRKSSEDLYPKQKVRHYDQEEVKKYMAKQQQQRKQQRLKEKQEEERKREEQQQKLKELYDKQQQAVKESIEVGKRKVYGETFVKLSEKISNIISSASYEDGSQESEDPVSSLKDVPTYQIPQFTSSPQKDDTMAMAAADSPMLARDDTVDEICKDSLEVTATTANLERSSVAAPQPISPYKPSASVASQINEESDVKSSPPADTAAASKASRVAAIHSTAAALRKRLDAEAKRISSLVQNRQAELMKYQTNTKPITSMEPTAAVEPVDVDPLTLPEPEGYSGGEIPGTANIDEQAKLNRKLKKMEVAAQKIQSFYRGHCSRKPTEMTTPSGLTLYEAFEGARRSALLSGTTAISPVQLASAGYPPISIPSKKNKKAKKTDEKSSKSDEKLSVNEEIDFKIATEISDIKADAQESNDNVLQSVDKMNGHSSDEGGSTASLISEAWTISKVLQQEPRISSKLSKYTTNSEHNSFPSYAGDPVSEKSLSLGKVLEKHKQVAGDRYSVINIFTRNYPSLRKQQIIEDMRSGSDSELDTEKILADAYEDVLKSSNGDADEDNDDLTEQSLELSLEGTVDNTLVEQSIKDAAVSTLAPREEDDHDESRKSSVTLSLADLPSKIQSRTSFTKDADYSQDFNTHDEEEEPAGGEDSDASQAAASYQSNAFSDIDTHDLKPVLSSTQRSMVDTREPTRTTIGDTKETTMDSRNGIHENGVSHNEEEELRMLKMSPNTLERKLKAELNHFEAVGSSLQQVTEMERVKNVVEAQQEVVTLAQVLKSRQASHKQELEKLSIAAKESALVNERDVEVVKRTAAEASVEMMKTMAEVKAKAAEDIAASAVQLAHIQQETTSVTLKALNEVEQARQHAATVYKQSVDQLLINGVKEKAASEVGYSEDFEDDKSQHLSSDENSTLKHSKTSGSGVLDGTLTSAAATSVIETTGGVQNNIASANTTLRTSGTIPDEYSPENRTKSSEQSSKASPATSEQKYSPAGSKSSPAGSIAEEVKSVRMENGISEEVGSVIHDDSQLLFEQKTLLSGNEDSLTEEELKQDFRAVLPSENHRRKSLDSFHLPTPGDTSSEDIALTPRSSAKWLKKKIRAKSPFADENTFSKFTANMVRQYIQEDEVRAKHQASLLELREKAIIDKTKAEMAYLEVQKKTLKGKGTDEKMPPITKKQRAVLMKLQAEQTEIRRLKEAHKAASYERRSMLYQQKEIQKIRESTQKIWSKLGSLNKGEMSPRTPRSRTLKSEESASADKSLSYLLNASALTPAEKPQQKKGTSLENSSAIPDEASQASEQLSKTASIEESILAEELPKTNTGSTSSTPKTAVNESVPSDEKETTPLRTKDSSARSSTDQSGSRSESSHVRAPSTRQASIDDSSIGDALKKLMYKSGEKYLAGREKKLESRKHQFAEIMMRETQLKEWREKIVDEETKLKQDIRKALQRGKVDSTSGGEKTATTSRTTSKSINREHQSSNSSVSRSEKASSIRNGSSGSLKEDYVSAKDSSVEQSIAEQISPEGTPPSQIRTVSSEKSLSKITPEEKLSSSVSHRYSGDSFLNESNISPRDSASKRYDEDSFTENTSDSSDIEIRLKTLQEEIESRNVELERLRKKNQKEVLRLKEQELKRQLKDVEKEIKKQNKENIPLPKSKDNDMSSEKFTQDSRTPESKSSVVPDQKSAKSEMQTEVATPRSEPRSEPRSPSKSRSSIYSESKSDASQTSTQTVYHNGSYSKIHEEISPLRQTQSHQHSSPSERLPSRTIKDSPRDISEEVAAQLSVETSHHSLKSDERISQKSVAQKSVSTSKDARESQKDDEIIESVAEEISHLHFSASAVSEEIKPSAHSLSKHISHKSEKNLSERKSISEVKSYAEDFEVGSPRKFSSKQSIEEIQSYGEDFEAESPRKAISRHSRASDVMTASQRTVSTEEDVSELSNEVIPSEHTTDKYSNKSSAEKAMDALSKKSEEKSTPKSHEKSVSENIPSKASSIVTEFEGDVGSARSATQLSGAVLSNKQSVQESPAGGLGYEDSFMSVTSRISTVPTAVPDESMKVDATAPSTPRSFKQDDAVDVEFHSEKSMSRVSQKSISDRYENDKSTIKSESLAHEKSAHEKSVFNNLSEKFPGVHLSHSVSEVSAEKSLPHSQSDKSGSKTTSKYLSEKSRSKSVSPEKSLTKSISIKSPQKISSVADDIAVFNVNDRVVVEGIMTGAIKFIGSTSFSPVVVAGIHLDDAVGTNDGTFQGGKFFECDPNYGLFATLDRLKHAPSEEREEKKKEVESEEKEGESEEVAEEVISEIRSVSMSQHVISAHDSSLQRSQPSSKHLDKVSSHSIGGETELVSAKESAPSLVLKKDVSAVLSEGDVRSQSSSDADTLDKEIPSPRKLDLNPMADNITNSIMKTLLGEALAMPIPRAAEEASVIPSSKKEVVSHVTVKPKELPNDITKQLIEDALSHMMKIKQQKQKKLQEGDLLGTNLSRKTELLSLVADEDVVGKIPLKQEKSDSPIADLDAQPLGLEEDLKSVQDHLDALCGVEESDDDPDNLLNQERVILPPKSFRFEEPPLQIPWTIQETRELVSQSLNQLTSDTSLNTMDIEPSPEYLNAVSDNKNHNTLHTKLYKKLVFDATKSILCEINDFHNLQKQSNVEWQKPTRKTFSKFIRTCHMLDKKSLCGPIADHISTCLDLKPGRPCLEKLKRKLPLNLNKKDYVDAVLVDEIREEEPLWVNYDQDEIRVKFQLADDILNSLLDEIVDIIAL